MLLSEIPWIRYGFGTRDSLPPEEPIAALKQVHSAIVVEARTPGLHGEGDALVTDTPGLGLAVRTADCVPILLADAANRAVAAIHAGWRGTVREIVPLTIERMREPFGTLPENVVVEIGPAIGQCCFEVGPEVAQQFSKWNTAVTGTQRKEHLDLGGITCAQLCEAGVPATHIRQVGLCTMCNPAGFFSFRREREAAGRMQSWIRAL